MKLFLTGGTGQVGLEVQRAFADWTIQAPARSEFDLGKPDTLSELIKNSAPNLVIHTGAMTAVDAAEFDLAQADLVNYQATAAIALACHQVGSRIIYLSTDYVFDGDHFAPYCEDHPTNPQSVYGSTKLRGELAVRAIANHLVVRTSWIYGPGKNFVRTMLCLAREGQTLRIVNDQIGRPTNARDLAQAIRALVDQKAATGVYHFQNSGIGVSWAQFTERILAEAGITHPVEKITTEQYLAANQGKIIAPRPKNSVLSLEKIRQFIRPRNWEEALAEYIREESQRS